MMDTTRLAEQWMEMWPRLTPLQRQGMLSSLMAANRDVPGNDALLDAIVTLAAGTGNGITWPKSLEQIAAMREALGQLGLADWRTFNNTAFVLHRGNVFDETVTALEGGGIEYGFAPRYLDFLGLIEEERAHLGISEPTLLDVGCWQGTLMLEMAQRGFQTQGTDIGDAMGPVIAERTALLKAEDRARVLGFRSGWAHEILPEMGQFDIITCQETLEHVPTAVLEETCEAMLGAARHSILVTVPGWDDGWPAHLRVFTAEQLVALFHPDENDVEVVRPPGVMCYTTVRVRRQQV